MMSARNFEAQALLLLARLSAAQGNDSEAGKFAKRAVSVMREVGLTFIGPTVLAVMASLTKDPAERKKALMEAEGILDSGCVAHNQFWFARSAIDDALTVGEWDDAERYAARLERYTREQPLAWADFTIARGRTLAALGRGSRDANLVAEIRRLDEIATKCNFMLARPLFKQALEAVEA